VTKGPDVSYNLNSCGQARTSVVTSSEKNNFTSDELWIGLELGGNTRDA